jgi:hypothetical protein
MKVIKLFILVIISFFIISAKGGCSSEENKPAVIGEWQWVKTFCCGRTSKWIDEKQCNCTQKLIITDDKKFEWYKNDTLKSSGNYELRKGINDTQYASGDSALVIILENSYPAYVEFIGDTLLLSMGYMDYSNDYFIRVKK